MTSEHGNRPGQEGRPPGASLRSPYPGSTRFTLWREDGSQREINIPFQGPSAIVHMVAEAASRSQSDIVTGEDLAANYQGIDDPTLIRHVRHVSRILGPEVFEAEGLGSGSLMQLKIPLDYDASSREEYVRRFGDVSQPVSSATRPENSSQRRRGSKKDKKQKRRVTELQEKQTDSVDEYSRREPLRDPHADIPTYDTSAQVVDTVASEIDSTSSTTVEHEFITASNLEPDDQTETSEVPEPLPLAATPAPSVDSPRASVSEGDEPITRTEQTPQSEHAAVRPVQLDPAVLLEDNVAAQIIDKGHLSNFVGHLFNPERYVPSETVRVKDPDAPQGFVYRLIDGHHRTQGAKQYIDTIDPDYEYWSNDVTDDIVAKNHNYAGQTELTAAQYLTEVIKPTKAHREIATARMAGHFMTEWSKMAGDEVAAEFSALAALNVLRDRNIKNQPDDRIVKYFKALRTAGRPLMANETAEKRAALERGLREMAGVIRETRLGHEDIQTAAFRILTQENETIGGSEVAFQQIRGLVFHPVIDEKLQQHFQGPQLEQRRTQLGELIISAFERTHEENDIQSLSELVVDPYINYENIIAILSAPKSTDKAKSVTERYNDVKQRINISKISGYIGGLRDRDDGPTDIEDTLIRQIAGTGILERDVAVSGAGEAVILAGQAIYAAKNVLTQIKDTEVRQQVEKRIDAIMTAGTPQQLRRTANALTKDVTAHRAEYADTASHELITQTVDGIFTQRHLAGPAGIVIRDQIIGLVEQSGPTLDPQELTRRVAEIYNLGEELFTQVITGDISLENALKNKPQEGSVTWTVRSDSAAEVSTGGLVYRADLAKLDAHLRDQVISGKMSLEAALAEQPWRQAKQRAQSSSGTGSAAGTSRSTSRPNTEERNPEIIIQSLRQRIALLEQERTRLTTENTRLRDELKQAKGEETSS